MNNEPEILDEQESPPPFLGSWRNVYGVVFLSLVFLVLLFYLFTKVFE